MLSYREISTPLDPIPTNFKKFRRLTLLSVLACILFEVNGVPPKDKSALFKKYPQLNANTTDSCVSGLNKNLISYLEYPYTKMREYGYH